MKTLINIIIFTLLTLVVYSQDGLADHLKNIEGIWIAEDYLNSFDKTKSSIKSRNAFNPDYPVGLRINKSEVTDGILNIGFSCLHDHSIYPEISKYVVVNGDTINEQGHFQVSINKSDSLNFYRTTDIDYFNNEFKAYLGLTISTDTLLILYRPATGDGKEETIRFRRINISFAPNYQFPNPIYYYTRSKTLVGTFTLRDSLNRVISSNFHIDFDGKTDGYSPFKDKIFYFSTDIYCGPEITNDYVTLCSYNAKLESKCDGFIYKRINERTIQLHKSEWIDEKQVKGKMIYKLTNKNFCQHGFVASGG